MKAYLGDIARTLAPRTVVTYGAHLDMLTGYLRLHRPRGRLTVIELSRNVLSDGWTWLRTTGKKGSRSVGMCNSIVTTWQAMWRWACDSDEYSHDMPRARRIDLPRVVRKVVPAATWAELDAMLTALEARPVHRGRRVDWERRVVVLARYTAMRHRAILLLDWDDVDLAEGRIHVRAETTKGGYGGRTLPLHPALAEELVGWGQREGPVVVVPRTANNPSTQCGSVVREAWEAAGVRPVVWQKRPVHGARRTLRTWLVLQAVPEPVIDAILGHQGRGVGQQVYTDVAALWPLMVAAVGTVPAVGASKEPTRLRREES